MIGETVLPVRSVVRDNRSSIEGLSSSQRYRAGRWGSSGAGWSRRGSHPRCVGLSSSSYSRDSQSRGEDVLKLLFVGFLFVRV